MENNDEELVCDHGIEWLNNQMDSICQDSIDAMLETFDARMILHCLVRGIRRERDNIMVDFYHHGQTERIMDAVRLSLLSARLDHLLRVSQ